MRRSCAPVMAELADEHGDLVAMGADGLSIFGALAERHPGRFVDVGIAEANLVGVAAGLARSGKRVFLGSIAAFLARRACEQIRNDVCNPGLDVTFVGIGGGLAYGMLGPTHHVVEDVALFRTMPHATVLVPADAQEARWALRTAARRRGPVYVRLGAREDPVVHDFEPKAELGAPLPLADGDDVAILASGICVSEALHAAAAVRVDGISAAVASIPTIRPLDAAALERAIGAARAVVVVEEASAAGGLGDLVAGLLGPRLGRRLARLAIDAGYAPVAGREALLRHHGIDRGAIAQAVRVLVEQERRCAS